MIYESEKKNYFCDSKTIEFILFLEHNLSSDILFFNDTFFVNTATYLFQGLDLFLRYII